MMYKMTPKLHKSHALLYPSLSASVKISGAMQDLLVMGTNKKNSHNKKRFTVTYQRIEEYRTLFSFC